MLKPPSPKPSQPPKKIKTRAEAEPLGAKDKERYSRHILLQNLGLSGVEKIRGGRVAVIGTGGLAAPLLTYLTVSGVGSITLIDHDRVAMANLARQFLFGPGDIGKPKVRVATDKLHGLNPRTEIIPIIEKAGKDNFERLTYECDVVVETVDSTAAKLMIHDLAFRHHKPLIHGAALAWEGQILTILPGETPCLRCFFPNLGIRDKGDTGGLPWEGEGDSCSTEGVLSPLCGIVGSYQAAEVLRFLSRPKEELHTGKVLRIDLIRNRHYYLYPQKKPCPCGWGNET